MRVSFRRYLPHAKLDAFIYDPVDKQTFMPPKQYQVPAAHILVARPSHAADVTGPHPRPHA
jgi:hypothetical protein